MKIKKRISFDYDGSLNDGIDGSVNTQKEEIQNFCKLLNSDERFEVFIITRRMDEIHKDVGLTDEHRDVHNLAAELGIPSERIFFTNRKSKLIHIIPLEIDVHIDDEMYDISQIREYNGKCIGVCVYPENNPENKNWKDYMSELLEL